MESYIVLGVLLGLPLLLGIVFRVSVSHLFFSLLAGEIIERYFYDDAILAGRMFTRNEDILVYLKLLLLVLPMILTAIFLKHTLSKGKAFFHLVPLLVTGVVFAAFAIPLLPEGLRNQLNMTEPGRILSKNTDIIVGAMVLSQLMTVWLLNRSHEGHKKRH